MLPKRYAQTGMFPKLYAKTRMFPKRYAKPYKIRKRDIYVPIRYICYSITLAHPEQS